MRAFAVRSFGEAPAILELPIPSEDGAYLIRVTYAGVNPVDFKLLDRLTADATFPFVVGVDFAGVVEGVPLGEHEFQVGERIFGMARTHGSYAEHTAVAPNVPLEALARIPESVTEEQAATLPVAALTALGSLDMLGVKAGQRLLIMGALGGVGGFAMQMARLRGAHVIATVRGDADVARGLGAEEVYDSTTVNVYDAIRAAHPDGVDAVLDLISDSDAIRKDAEILKCGGSLVSAIYAADEPWFAEHQITAHNITGGNNPVMSPKGLDKVARMLADGDITTRIREVVELDNAGQILEKLRKGGFRGKAVVAIR